jgi:hypothetical protein
MNAVISGACLSDILIPVIKSLYHPAALCNAHVHIVRFVPVIDLTDKLGIFTMIFCPDIESIDIAVLFPFASKLISEASCDPKTVSSVVSVYIFN